MKHIKLGFVGLIIAGLLVACSDNSRPTVVPTKAPAPPTETVAPTTPTPGLTRPPSTTEVVAALLPTGTPPIVPPTRFPTATPRPGQSVPEVGPSLTAIRTTKVSFQTAYGKAAARMSNVNGAARLVLAQTTLFTVDRTVWTFFFTPPQGTRSWSVIYDSGGAKDAKELLTLVDRPGALLPDEAGQWQANKLLDSDEIGTRLTREGLPPDLPIDTVYVQQVTANKQGKVPAYVLVNGALNKQIIINGLTGAVIQNDFL